MYEHSNPRNVQRNKKLRYKRNKIIASLYVPSIHTPHRPLFPMLLNAPVRGTDTHTHNTPIGRSTECNIICQKFHSFFFAFFFDGASGGITAWCVYFCLFDQRQKSLHTRQKSFQNMNAQRIFQLRTWKKKPQAILHQHTLWEKCGSMKMVAVCYDPFAIQFTGKRTTVISVSRILCIFWFLVGREAQKSTNRK